MSLLIPNRLDIMYWAMHSSKYPEPDIQILNIDAIVGTRLPGQAADFGCLFSAAALITGSRAPAGFSSATG
jgi:hypothetical protein